MSLLTVNSNNIFGRVVEEAGTYNVKIVNSQLSKSKGRGYEMVTLDFEVLDGKYAGGTIKYQNLVWVNDSEHDREVSERRINTFLVALGLEDGTVIDSMSDVARGSLNKQLAVDTVWGDPDNKGNIYLQVRNYRKFNPDGSKPNGVRRPGDNTPTSNSNTNSTPLNNTDPFANSGDSIDVSDDDLPF